MEKIDTFKAILDNNPVTGDPLIDVTNEVIERMYWALKGTLQHVADCRETGYKVDGEFIEWHIDRSLEGEV